MEPSVSLALADSAIFAGAVNEEPFAGLVRLTVGELLLVALVITTSSGLPVAASREFRKILGVEFEPSCSARLTTSLPAAFSPWTYDVTSMSYQAFVVVVTVAVAPVKAVPLRAGLLFQLIKFSSQVVSVTE